jgi:hypothetical protein
MQLDVGHEHMFACGADGSAVRGAAGVPKVSHPELVIRAPAPADADAIAGLLGELGYPTTGE